MADSVYLDDRLGRGGCSCSPECRYIVSNFRFATGRFRRLRGGYISCTPSEYAALPFDIRGERHMLAVIDLDAYRDYDAVLETARTVTEKRGRVNREIARAERMGYRVAAFAAAQYVPDIVAIHGSTDERGGRPMEGRYYFKTVEEMGGAPWGPVPIAAPICPEHDWEYWGVFKPEPGHRQGAVQTDQRLVGYIRLRRQGDSCSYTFIMGHADYLDDGVMYLLHFGIVKALLERPQRPRYLLYLNFGAGHGNSLRAWKRRALFKPYILHYVEERPIDLPSPMPAAADAQRALQLTLWTPWPAAVEIAARHSVDEGWLKALHRGWVVQQSHAPSLLAGMLRQPASLDALRPLASGLFPIEELAGCTRVGIVLQKNTRGLDTLTPLFDRGLQDVTVFHPDGDNLLAIEALFGPRWSYEAFTPSTTLDRAPAFDAIVVEVPVTLGRDDVMTLLAATVGNFRGLLLLSLNAETLFVPGFDEDTLASLFLRVESDSWSIEASLSLLVGRPVNYRGMHYRHADVNDIYWCCVSLD